MTVGAAAVAAGGWRRSSGPFEIKDLQNPDPERSRGSRARLARPGAGCLAPARSDTPRALGWSRGAIRVAGVRCRLFFT
jgi:hypothetical protein